MSLRRPPARGLSRRFRTRRRPKRLVWRAFSTGTGVLAPDAATRLVLIPTTSITKLTSPTIMRIRGEILVNLDTATPVLGDSALVYLGIGLQDTSMGLPGSQFENPFNESFSNDWMWWQTTSLYRTATDGDSTTAVVRYQLDVRSKRRVDETDDLVAVVVNQAPDTQPRAIGLGIFGRVLLQETS